MQGALVSALVSALVRLCPAVLISTQIGPKRFHVHRKKIQVALPDLRQVEGGPVTLRVVLAVAAELMVPLRLTL
ncbi:hypothetical protein CLH61_10290 [Marinobacter profundi]|uniref:Uncharacterized protein n=1 Tax=Marinobacter profundi TaxID=2666256 RepID=A0A2G1UM40_9GAMM|nr:hypothetical protein CLH61_10290 [Marinobacter profundi]